MLQSRIFTNQTCGDVIPTYMWTSWMGLLLKPTNRLYRHGNVPQHVLYLQLFLSHWLGCWVRSQRSGGRILSEMVHYVRGAPRIVPVCRAKRRGECDVHNLTVVGPNPGETGALLFLHIRHTPATHTHTNTYRRKHTWYRFRFSSATVQTAPRINTRSLSEPARPAIAIRTGLTQRVGNER